MFFQELKIDKMMPKDSYLLDTHVLFVDACLVHYSLFFIYTNVFFIKLVLYTNIDPTLVNSLHGLLNCEIGGLECRVSTTEYSLL